MLHLKSCLKIKIERSVIFEDTMSPEQDISKMFSVCCWPIISWYEKYFVPMCFLCFRTVVRGASEAPRPKLNLSATSLPDLQALG